MGTNRDESIVLNMELFAQKLLELGWNSSHRLTRQRYIATVYVAYAQAQGRALDQSFYWIVFPIHSLPRTQAIYLVQDFPKVYFLHMVREFIQNMGSQIKHFLKNTTNSVLFSSFYLLEATMRQVYLDQGTHTDEKYELYGIYPYLPDTPDRRISSRAVRLEDLHKDSENTLRKITKWIGLKWDPILLKSTYDGKLWNNRPETIRQAGIGTGTISQKHEEIFNRFDRWRLRQIGKPRYLFYHYAQENDFAPYLVRRFVLPLLFWLPFKVEWKYPHYRRIHALLLKFIAQGRDVSIGKLKANADTLNKSRLPILGIMSAYMTLKNVIRFRQYLLMAWRKNLSAETQDFVPLLHSREASAHPFTTPADTASDTAPQPVAPRA